MDIFAKKLFARALLGAALLLTACASGLVTSEGEAPRKAPRTVVLFLVDGLSAPLLKASLEQNRVPNTRRFFLRGENGFRVARASFPTLTYPNISSILTGRRVGAQPIISNHMFENGEVVDYESAGSHDHLRAQIDPVSVFGAFGKEGAPSASFSYVFGLNATEHMEFGLREGLEYQDEDFRSLDGRLIENLERFLTERKPGEWPEFIYVHLVGVDGEAHHHGARSRAAIAHLAWLDRRLERTYRLLERAEALGRPVESILTADHGFEDLRAHVDVESVVHADPANVTVTNEGRILELYFPPGANVRPLLRKLRRHAGVELTALRNGNTVELETRTQKLRFAFGPALCAEDRFSLALVKGPGFQPAAAAYQCPDQFRQPAPYPFLVPDLAAFLSVPKHPDAVVIAKPGVSFTDEFRANHGGPTAEELFVPLLLRNSTIPERDLARTSDLLRSFAR